MQRLFLAMLVIAATLLVTSAHAQSGEPFGLELRKEQGSWWVSAREKVRTLGHQKLVAMVEEVRPLQGTERLLRVRKLVTSQLPQDCVLQVAAMHTVLGFVGVSPSDMRILVDTGKANHTMLAVKDGQDWRVLDNGFVVKGFGAPRWQEVKNFHPDYVFD